VMPIPGSTVDQMATSTVAYKKSGPSLSERMYCIRTIVAVLPLKLLVSEMVQRIAYSHCSKSEDTHDHRLGLLSHFQVPHNEDGKRPESPVSKGINRPERIS
jgi:hypothetical protein